MLRYSNLWPPFCMRNLKLPHENFELGGQQDKLLVLNNTVACCTLPLIRCENEPCSWSLLTVLRLLWTTSISCCPNDSCVHNRWSSIFYVRLFRSCGGSGKMRSEFSLSRLICSKAQCKMYRQILHFLHAIPILLCSHWQFLFNFMLPLIISLTIFFPIFIVSLFHPISDFTPICFCHQSHKRFHSDLFIPSKHFSFRALLLCWMPNVGWKTATNSKQPNGINDVHVGKLDFACFMQIYFNNCWFCS